MEKDVLGKIKMWVVYDQIFWIALKISNKYIPEYFILNQMPIL